MAKAADEIGVQYAALPWRRTATGAAQVLLITSRGTGRWVIPKGWAKKREAPVEAAAREAFEEAGIEGRASPVALGDYHYRKTRKDGSQTPVRVTVYALEALREHAAWPEKDEREKLWTDPGEAARLVAEPELQALLAAFAPEQVRSI